MQDWLFLPPDHASPSLTLFTVYGVGVLGLAALWLWTVRCALVHRRRMQLAERAQATADAALHVGRIVVHGRVLDDGEQQAAVRVDLHLRGTQSKDKYGNWSHRWSEQHRVRHERPFTLVRPDGQQVRVEPDANVLLVDALDLVQDIDVGKRVISARLEPGEEVYVAGVMSRGSGPDGGVYRDGGAAWVLRPSHGERMLVSTEPLGARHARRMRWHRGWAAGILAFAAFAHGVLFRDVHRLEHARLVDGQVERTDWSRHWVSTKSGGYWSITYRAHAFLTDENGAPFAVDPKISRALYDRLKEAGEHDPLPFLVRLDAPRLAVMGTRPTGDKTAIWAGLLLAILLALAQWGLTFRSRPWWERKYLRARSGQLPGPAIP